MEEETPPRLRARIPALALIGAALAIAVSYLLVAASAEGNLRNDAAYYFGVARHIALTGRFEEPLVWNFLHPPAQAVHAPFDYWSGLSSLVLVPVFQLFGATDRVAMVAMGVISSLSVVLFALLLLRTCAVRSRLVGLVALALFAWSPSMAEYRFDTESLPLFHVLLVASLYAFLVGRRSLAVVCAFGVFLTRGDGVVPMLFVWTAALWVDLRATRRLASRPVLSRLGLMAGLTAAYVVHHLATFGTPGPPAALAVQSLADYGELYALPSATGARGLWARFGPGAIADTVRMAYANLWSIEFVRGLQPLWFALVIAGAAAVRRRPGLALVFALAIAGPACTAVASGAVFSPHRTLYTYLPVLILAGAVGLDEVADALGRLARRPLVRLGAAVALSAVFLVPLRPYGARRVDTHRGVERRLGELDPILGGAPVATNRPFWVMARTSSPAVMIPSNGPEAIAEAIERYEIRWLLLWTPHFPVGASRRFMGDVSNEKVRRIGRFRLEPARSPIAGVQLFRVAD